MNKKLKTFVLAGVITVVTVVGIHTGFTVANIIRQNELSKVSQELTNEDQLYMFTQEVLDTYNDDGSYISAAQNTFGLNIVKFSIVCDDINVFKGYSTEVTDKMEDKLNELRDGLGYLYFQKTKGLKPVIYINLYDCNGKLVYTVNSIHNEYDDNKHVDLKWLSEFRFDLY